MRKDLRDTFCMYCGADAAGGCCFGTRDEQDGVYELSFEMTLCPTCRARLMDNVENVVRTALEAATAAQAPEQT